MNGESRGPIHSGQRSRRSDDPAEKRVQGEVDFLSRLELSITVAQVADRLETSPLTALQKEAS